MDVKKYRLYLWMIVLGALVAIGTLSYLYFTEQEKSYHEGTLVQNECIIEEELA